MFVPMLVCICVRLFVFVFTISCECLCINCQTTRTLQQSQTIFKIFLSKEKVFYQMLALESLHPTVKPNNLLKVVYQSVHCLLHLHTNNWFSKIHPSITNVKHGTAVHQSQKTNCLLIAFLKELVVITSNQKLLQTYK